MLNQSEEEQLAAFDLPASTSSSAALSPEATASGGTGKRHTKYYKDKPEQHLLRNVRTHAVIRYAELLCGGRASYRALTAAERAEVRAHAWGEYKAQRLAAARRLRPTSRLPVIHRESPTDERAFPENDRRGYVYAMIHPAFDGVVKIGSASDCNRRLATFNTGCPQRAFCMTLHVMSNNRLKAERAVHAALAAYRLPGGEWFRIDLETVERELFVVEEYVWEEA